MCSLLVSLMNIILVSYSGCKKVQKSLYFDKAKVVMFQLTSMDISEGETITCFPSLCEDLCLSLWGWLGTILSTAWLLGSSSFPSAWCRLALPAAAVALHWGAAG